MTMITAKQASENFASLSALLLATSPSEKATAFATRVISDVNARGPEWMAANAVALQILSPFGSLEQDRQSPAPVSDNRPYFMGQLQVALRD